MISSKNKIAAFTQNAFVVMALALFLIVLSSFIPYSPNSFNANNLTSTKIYDRNGILLRRLLSSYEGTAVWVNNADIPENLKAAFISAEDKRFYVHHGIDLHAIVRVLREFADKGHIRSGASTITQQLIRMIRTERQRNILTKLHENWLALRLENAKTKDFILEQYLNRVPMGNEIYGIGAASESYFNKSVQEMTVAEMAFIAAIPKSPAGYNPYRYFSRTVRRQKKILRLMLNNHFLPEDDYHRVFQQKIIIAETQYNFKAPHFCDRIISKMKKSEQRPEEIHTTIDCNYQEKIQNYVNGRIDQLKPFNAHNAAVLVVENSTNNILVWIGSQNYLDTLNAGQVDGIISLRQPGSTLKPFTYGLAMINGYTASSVIPDIELHAQEEAGYYTPNNFDNVYHGPVTVRRALACSYNVPPVRILEELGEAALLKTLRNAGFVSLNKHPSHYGKGLTLGNGEVTLLELVRAYAGLVNQGKVNLERSINSVTGAAQNLISDSYTVGTMFNPEICAILLDILMDNEARIPAFGRFNPLHFAFECAAKTGTSKDFRDNWAVGCTSELTAGVWVGNFNGESMHNVSGISGAAPLLNDVLHFLDKYYSFSNFEDQKNIKQQMICSLSGMRDNKNCPERIREKFIRGTAPTDTCTWHRRVRILSDNDEGVHESNFKIYLDLPPLYLSWLEESGMSSIQQDEAHKHAIHSMRSEDEGGRFRILSPKAEDVFKIDSILRPDFQRLQLKVEVPDRINEVKWYINGKHHKTVHHPFNSSWQLRPGKYKFKAVGRGIEVDSVEISVLP